MFESYCFGEIACTLKEQESLGWKNKKHFIFVTTVLVKGYYFIEVLILSYTAFTLNHNIYSWYLLHFKAKLEHRCAGGDNS